MNPEYVILGGFMWRLSGKRVLLWYTHKAVNLRLRLATWFASGIYTASKESFRLKSKKVTVVGHGIDTNLFSYADRQGPRDVIQLLSVGRISPVKYLETIILACHGLQSAHPLVRFTLDIVGDTVTRADRSYLQSLHTVVRAFALSDTVRFVGGKAHQDMPEIYAKSDLLIHTSRTGSVDKVVLEALSTGLPVATSSEAYGAFDGLLERFFANDPKGLQSLLEKILLPGILPRNPDAAAFVKERYSLDRVIDRIVAFFAV